jgi:hypothetical protein
MTLLEHLKTLSYFEMTTFLKQLLYYTSNKLNQNPSDIEVKEFLTKSTIFDRDEVGYKEHHKRVSQRPGLATSEEMKSKGMAVFFDCGDELKLKIIRNDSEQISLFKIEKEREVKVALQNDYLGELVNKIDLKTLEDLSSLARAIQQLNNAPAKEDQKVIDEICAQTKTEYSKPLRTRTVEEDAKISRKMKRAAETKKSSVEEIEITSQRQVAPEQTSQSASAAAGPAPAAAAEPDQRNQAGITITVTSARPASPKPRIVSTQFAEV